MMEAYPIPRLHSRVNVESGHIITARSFGLYLAVDVVQLVDEALTRRKHGSHSV